MRWFVLALLAVSFPAFAEDKDPRPEMHVLAQELSALQKFLLTENGFLAPENSGKIQKSLETLTDHLKNLKKESFQNDPALKANAAMLATHMEETSELFKAGNKSFARYMLQSSMQMCIACHTRDKSLDFALPEGDLENLKPLERAHFYFATRQFEKGKALFEEAVAGYPKNELSATELRASLLSLAVFYARVKEKPGEGASYFAKVADRRDLPSYLRKEVSAWAGDFSQWAGENPSKEKLTEVQMVAAARKLLASDDFSLAGDSDRIFHIRRLRASSLLHQVLEAPGERSPMKAQALLLLGQIYQRITYNLFFRFGEMYLKACIREYKKTKVARDCYDALEQAVSEGFTGSAGTNIPEEDQVELFQLKRLAY